MDPYDDTQHGHPSQSIHNAAYPDAPYQPGQGQQPQDRDQHQLRLDTSSSPGTYDHSSSYPLSSHPSSSRHTRSPSSQWSDHAAPGAALTSPQDPPPPYAARQPPQPANSYSPLNGPLLANQSPSTSSDGGRLGPMIPMQPMQSYSSNLVSGSLASRNGYYAPPASSMHQSYLAQQQQRQQQQPHLVINNDDVLVSTAAAAGKPVPLTDAKWRKRRRLKICLITITLLVILFVALTVGVAWKVFDLGRPPRDDSGHWE